MDVPTKVKYLCHKVAAGAFLLVEKFSPKLFHYDSGIATTKIPISLSLFTSLFMYWVRKVSSCVSILCANVG